MYKKLVLQRAYFLRGDCPKGRLIFPRGRLSRGNFPGSDCLDTQYIRELLFIQTSTNVMTTMRVAVISVSINQDRMNVGVEPATNLMAKTVLV